MEEKIINQGTICQVIYGDVHIQQFCMPGAPVVTSAATAAEPSPVEGVTQSVAAEGVPSERRKGGRTAEPLFRKRDGSKDEELTRQMAQQLSERLAQRQGSYGSEWCVDSSVGNPVNVALVSLYQSWARQGLVEPRQPNGAAIYRFLHEDCQLSVAVDGKAFAGFIRKTLVAQQ